MYYVYIIKGTKYYIGRTNNLSRRFNEHKLGKVKSTRRYGALQLVGYFAFETKDESIVFEKTIKKAKNTKTFIGTKGFIYN